MEHRSPLAALVAFAAHAAKPTPQKPPALHLRSSVYPTSVGILAVLRRLGDVSPCIPVERREAQFSRTRRAQIQQTPLNAYSGYLRGTFVAIIFENALHYATLLRLLARLAQCAKAIVYALQTRIVGMHRDSDRAKLQAGSRFQCARPGQLVTPKIVARSGSSSTGCHSASGLRASGTTWSPLEYFRWLMRMTHF